MAEGVTLQEVLELTKRLSLVDKVRLIEQVAPQIEQELKGAQPVKRTPVGGMWKGLNVTDEEIEEARREMWGNFPREDI